MWMLCFILLQLLEIDCAKYRKKQGTISESVEHSTVRPSSSLSGSIEHEEVETTLLLSGNPEHNSSKEDTRERPIMAKLKDDPLYYTKAKRIERKARTIFNSSKNSSMEDCLKKAREEVTKRSRSHSSKSRLKRKDLGIKKKDSRKKGYERKENVIGRKIVSLLKEDRNGVFLHDIAREKAEEWYLSQTSARSAKYRKNQKLLKSKQEINKEE